MSFLTRRKALPALGGAAPRAHGLKPTLSWPHLVALGVGAIVGTGIYTLIGVGAERAGPAVMLAFVIAGVVCVCAALAYVVFLVVVKQEEQLLAERFGDAYRDYLARVPRFLPNPRLWHDEPTLTIRPPRVLTTFGDALVFLLSVPIAETFEYFQDIGVIPVLLHLP